MTVSPQYLAEHFDDVAAAARSGEVVEVAGDADVTFRLIVVPSVLPAGPGSRVFGTGRADGDGSSMSFEQWEQIDRDWKADFSNGFGDI